MNPTNGSASAGGKPLGGASESSLIRALSRHLSTEEKKICDHEVAEHAKRYFGGLSSGERRLLGIDNAPAVDPARVESDSEFADEVAADLDAVRGVWLRAVLCLAAFAGVVYWVVIGN